MFVLFVEFQEFQKENEKEKEKENEKENEKEKEKENENEKEKKLAVWRLRQNHKATHPVTVPFSPFLPFLPTSHFLPISLLALRLLQILLASL